MMNIKSMRALLEQAKKDFPYQKIKTHARVTNLTPNLDKREEYLSHSIEVPIGQLLEEPVVGCGEIMVMPADTEPNGIRIELYLHATYHDRVYNYLYGRNHWLFQGAYDTVKKTWNLWTG